MFSAEPGADASAWTRSAAYHAGETTEEQLKGLRHDALISLAGPIANAMCLEKSSAFNVGSEDDMAHVRSCATKIVLIESGRPAPTVSTTINVDQEMLATINSIVETLTNEAQEIVKSRWLAIEAVATELIKTNLLDEATLDQIIVRHAVSGNL